MKNSLVGNLENLKGGRGGILERTQSESFIFFEPESVREVAASIKTDAKKSNVKIRRKKKKDVYKPGT